MLSAERPRRPYEEEPSTGLTDGLAALEPSTTLAGTAAVAQVAFAAHDMDAGVFRDVAQRLARRADRFMLYASSKDKALQLSERLARYPRAGQSGPGIFVLQSVDTIDATELDTGLMSHSYIGDHDSILSDVRYLIRQGLPPGERFGLTPVPHTEGQYWVFRPPPLTPAALGTCGPAFGPR